MKQDKKYRKTKRVDLFQFFFFRLNNENLFFFGSASSLADSLDFSLSALFSTPEESESFLKVYTNPTTAKLIAEGLLVNNGHLELQDKLGRVVYMDKVMSGLFKTSLSLENYSNGIYFLKVTSKDIDYIKKVVKQ